MEASGPVNVASLMSPSDYENFLAEESK